jgi:hypothetical protein
MVPIAQLNFSVMKLNMKILFGLSILFISWKAARSQSLAVPIVEVDSNFFSIKDQLPFDRKFQLKIQSNNNPHFVDYLELGHNRTWYQTIRHYTRTRKLFGIFPIKSRDFYFKTVPTENISMIKEKGTNFVYVTFGQYNTDKKSLKSKENNFLKPESQYASIIP